MMREAAATQNFVGMWIVCFEIPARNKFDNPSNTRMFVCLCTHLLAFLLSSRAFSGRQSSAFVYRTLVQSVVSHSTSKSYVNQYWISSTYIPNDPLLWLLRVALATAGRVCEPAFPTSSAWLEGVDGVVMVSTCEGRPRPASFTAKMR